jgi:hypothetical protein
MHEQEPKVTSQVFSFDLAGTDPSVNTIQYTEPDYSRRTLSLVHHRASVLTRSASCSSRSRLQAYAGDVGNGENLLQYTVVSSCPLYRLWDVHDDRSWADPLRHGEK